VGDALSALIEKGFYRRRENRYDQKRLKESKIHGKNGEEGNEKEKHGTHHY